MIAINNSLISLSISTFLLTGCISVEDARKNMSYPIIKDYQAKCFDIGSGINSNLITDDYFEALNVNNSIDCVIEGSKLTPLTEEKRAIFIRDVLASSANLSHLDDKTKTSLGDALEKYSNLVRDNQLAKEINEKKQRIEAEAKRIEQERQRKLKAEQHTRKALRLCNGKTTVSVGDTKNCMLHVMGQPSRINTTSTVSGTISQYVFEGLSLDGSSILTFIYIENNKVTGFQESTTKMY